MSKEKHRYFIELYPESTLSPPRWREAEIRREQALAFIMEIGEWLKREALDTKVSDMVVTVLGQVQIVCEADIITQIRNAREPDIAMIRSGAQFAENLGRFG
jgi:hypothetical protein